jgi:Ca-activated chloride channel homolog
MNATKTALILGASGAAMATALVLSRSHAATPAIETPTHVEQPMACGTPAPSHADKKLGHGKLVGALSAGKLARAGGGELHASFELVTDPVANAQRPPLDLAVVIDRSGSMEGERLDHAKSAARGIVDRLGERDHVALVQYDDTAQVVVGSLAMDASGKAKIDAAINAMRTGGSTNLEAGLELGRHEVERVYHTGEASRLILLSDGRANMGIVDPKQIEDHARDAASHGVRVTSVGIGLDFNEDLMEGIAEAGRGNYHYVKDAGDLDKVVAGELASVQATVATNVELHLMPACASAQVVTVHGYESHKDGAGLVVPMADLFGGDDRKLLVSLHVPDGAVGSIGAVQAQLVYRDTNGGATHTESIELGVEVTDDNAAAAASVDQDVMAQAMKVEAAESMREAAQAYDRGDQAGAQRILTTASHHIAAKSAAYKMEPAKTAEALGDLDTETKQVVNIPAATPAAADMVKATKAKARAMAKH